jgi:hypothetical protein
VKRSLDDSIARLLAPFVGTPSPPAPKPEIRRWTTMFGPVSARLRRFFDRSCLARRR